MAESRYVHYGCGWSAPAGWRNFDASPTLRFERIPLVGRLYTRNASRFPRNAAYGDIVKGLPVPPGSCDGVYCSHVLEHLSLEELRAALKNSLLILRPGGIFRLTVPDLERAVRRYAGNPSTDAAIELMKETGLGHESRPRGPGAFLVAWLGCSRHLWMWDYKAIEKELLAAGFVDVRRASFGDSPDPRFREVEEKARWDDGLGIECRRPGEPPPGRGGA